MPTDDYLSREPERKPYDLLTSLAPMLIVMALVALILGFGLGQIIQSQFAGIAARNEMLVRAVGQFDEAVTSAEDLAASAQNNIVAVFGANGVTPEGPVPPDKKAEGTKTKRGTPQTFPSLLPLHPLPRLDSRESTSCGLQMTM